METSLGSTKKTFFKTLLIFFLMLVLSSLTSILTLGANAIYPKLYSYQEVHHGAVDLSSSSLSLYKAPYVWERISGDYAFYYGQWLVSEAPSSSSPSAYRDPLRPWTEDGYPKNGYGSYKLEISGLHSGLEYSLTYVYGEGAYRVYWNGGLLIQKGQPGKTPETTERDDIDSGLRYCYWLTPTSEGKATLVFEIGNLDNGGLFELPALVARPDQRTYTADPYDVYLRILVVIAFIAIASLMTAAFVVYFGFAGKEVNISTPLFLLILALALFFSLDFSFFASSLALYHPFFASLVGTLLMEGIVNGAAVLYLFRNHYIEVKNKKNARICFFVYLGLNLALSLTAIWTYGYPIQLLFWILLSLTPLPYLWLSAKQIVMRRKYAIWTGFVLPAVMSFFLVQAYDDTNALIYQSTDFPSGSMLVLVLAITVVLMMKVRSLREEEKRKDRLALEYDKIKEESLKEQIKPHFVFNCLTAIENSYHKDVQSGDEAMKMFASHLRTNVDSMGQDLIPFEKELANILNYVDLENLRLEKKFEVLLDISFQDFLLPPLSLQPLVENSIKYSKVNEKEDGYITISSSLDEEKNVHLIVSDNGIGYDVTKVGVSSVGVKNLEERLKILLNARVEIETAPGEGTKTHIVFPLKR